MLKRILLHLFCVLAIGSGCAPAVTIERLIVPESLRFEDLSSLSTVHLALEVPPTREAASQQISEAALFRGIAREESAFGIEESSATFSMSPEGSSKLVRQVKKNLEKSYSHFITYQIVRSTEQITLAKHLSASSTLVLQLGRIHLREQTAALELRYGLFKEPEHILLSEGKIAAETQKQERPLLEEKLSSLLAGKLEEQIALYVQKTNRPLFRTRQKQAYQLAKSGQYQKAKTLWLEETELFPFTWEVFYNLGALEEGEKDYGEAKGFYRKAVSLEPPSRRKKYIQGILQELDRPSFALPEISLSTSAESWFRQKLAVLPMENESLDLQAPEYIRAKLIESLKDRAYDVLSAEMTDEALRKFGITQGGQLKIASPRKLGKEIKADILLYGSLLDFRAIPAGFFYRKIVHARFKLVRSGDEAVLMDWEEKIDYAQTGSSREFVENLALQILDTALSKIFRTYLKEEADLIVESAVERFPLKF